MKRERKKKIERDPRRNNNNYAKSNVNTTNTPAKTCVLPPQTNTTHHYNMPRDVLFSSSLNHNR